MEVLMCTSVRRVALVLLGLGAAMFTIRTAATGRRVRQFNKHVLNRFALWLVGRRPMYYGVIHHIGRRSGRTYSTPVVAKVCTSGIIIPLPYGADTDWCQNLLAAGHGTLTLAGADYSVDRPTIVGTAIAGPLVPAATARVWRWMGIEKYLKLNVERLADASLDRAA